MFNKSHCGFKRFGVLHSLSSEERRFLEETGLPIKFKHSGSRLVGDGVTYGLPNSNIEIVLGTNRLSLYPIPFSSVSDADAARLVDAYFHEKRHVDQTFDDAQKCDFKGFRMAVSLLAARNNPELFGRNQLMFLCEQDARSVALQPTCDFLANYVGESVARDIVLSGFNSNQLGRNGLFGDKHYDSIDDIVSDFDKLWEFTSKQPMYFDFTREVSDDEVAIALRLFDDDVGPEWLEFRDKFMWAASADQFVMMASTHLYLHPEMMSSYSAFSGFDMSPEAVFGQEFPESRMEMLSRLPESYLSSFDRNFLNMSDSISMPSLNSNHTRDMRDIDASVSDIESDISPESECELW